jgi:hypothetical protein
MARNSFAESSLRIKPVLVGMNLILIAPCLNRFALNWHLEPLFKCRAIVNPVPFAGSPTSGQIADSWGNECHPLLRQEILALGTYRRE